MFLVNLRSSVPIYDQLEKSIRDLIASGKLKPDEQLPAIRECAVRNAINPNTVARAYRELEQKGMIYSVPGKGSFVAPGDNAINEVRKKAIDDFSEAAKNAVSCGVEPEKLRNILESEIGND